MGEKPKHTPTPWRVFTTKDGRKLVGVGDKDGQGILDCGFGVWSWMHADGIANAELIVRAVNSHDALVKALRGLLRFCDQATSYEATHPWQFGAYIDAKAALAAFQDAE